MKITGFTFVRNAIIYDYPAAESIRSILPLCDNFIVAVGASDDATHTLIRNIDRQKVKIIDTIWDDSLREGGKVLAQETNKAFQSVPADSDWAFYLQADEVVHEKYLEPIHNACKKWKSSPNVDGLLFKYLHFYGSYNYIGSSPRWYPREIRIIRNDKHIYSYRDAQGFRKRDNQKLGVKPIDAYVYHYGWVKEPKALQHKLENFNRYWHDDTWISHHIPKTDSFDYSSIDALQRFAGTHPQVMQKRIAEKNWRFEHDISFNRLDLKNRMKRMFEKYLGIRIGEYRNYRII